AHRPTGLPARAGPGHPDGPRPVPLRRRTVEGMSPITPKPLGRALRLEVADDPAPGTLANRVKNPSGELGGWGWNTPVASTSMGSHQDASRAWWLDFNTGNGGVRPCSPPEPVSIAANRWAAASFQLATT